MSVLSSRHSRSNPPGSSTLGAPILILVNDFPSFRFLRVKLQADNASFSLPGRHKYEIDQQYCLKLSRHAEDSPDYKPVLLFEQGSPELREASFVEATREVKTATADRLKTWCVPPVKVDTDSMARLWQYMERLPRQTGIMQPGGYFRAARASLPHAHQTSGRNFYQEQQQVRARRAYSQPQGEERQFQMPFYSPTVPSSRPNVTNHYPQYLRPGVPLRDQSNGQDVLQVPSNGAQYYDQSYVPLHTWHLAAPGPQVAFVEPTMLPVYNPHLGNEWAPFLQANAPTHPEGTHGYGHGWAPMQPQHGYFNAPTVTTHEPTHPDDAQTLHTSVFYTAAMIAYAQSTHPRQRPYAGDSSSARRQ